MNPYGIMSIGSTPNGTEGREVAGKVVSCAGQVYSIRMLLNRPLFSLLFSVFLIPGFVSGSLHGSGPIQVSDDFESGNLGNWHFEGDTRLVFQPHKDYDQDRINTAVTWFYGKLSNVLGREVEIVIEGLDYTVYNGKRGEILPFERNTVPVFSYDGEHWERFSNCGFDSQNRVFRIRQIFGRDEAWIAYMPPYTFSRLERLLQRLESNPAVEVSAIGKSVEGRQLYLVSVASPGLDLQSAPTVWIVARQHSFEAGGSWAVEGLLEFLTSGQPEAREILQRVVFKICPMLNPDGVVSGGTRFNTTGVDLNRHWNSADPLSHDRKQAPEIVYVKEALHRWKVAQRLDLFINIHNNDMVWNEDGDYIRFAPAEKEVSARTLERILGRETIFTGSFLPSTNLKATESVVAAELDTLGLLMEMKTGYLEGLGRWTGTDLFLAHGRNLARAIAAFFGE